MPTNVVHTKADERHWRMAKAAAKKAGEAGNWRYVMGAYEDIKKNARKGK